MIQPLHEIVGLPPTTASRDIAQAANRQLEALMSRASSTDASAQEALVVLKYAYLVWAYANPESQGATLSRR